MNSPSFPFARNTFRPACLAPLDSLPELMSLGEIELNDEYVPAVAPVFWRESLSITHQADLADFTAQVVEAWAVQLLVQGWGRLRLWVYDPKLNSTFSAIEALAQKMGLSGRKSSITFLRTKAQIEAAAIEWKEIASERKARLSLGGALSWQELVNQSDGAEDFCLVILSSTTSLYDSRIQEDLPDFIVNGARFGLLFWSLFSDEKTSSEYEYKQRTRWIDAVRDASPCNFEVNRKQLVAQGKLVKMQPFSTYSELGDIHPVTFTPEEQKRLCDTVEAHINQEKADEKTDYFEIEVGSKNGQPYYLRLGPNSELYHGMMSGGTGKGKTVFLRHVIVSACEKYTPDQVQFHIFDFKDGGDFNLLGGLAHIAHLHSECRSPSAVIEALEAFVAEGERRNQHFKSVQKEGYSGGDLFDYNRWAGLNGHRPFPFRVLFLDEIAKLFLLVDEDYDQRKKLLGLFTHVATLGRSPGLALLLTSQSFSDLPSGVDSLRSHIQLRMSLQLNSPSDCYGIFESGNTAAYHQVRSDNKIRQILINPEAGRTSGNHIVQLPKLKPETIVHRISAVGEKWKHHSAQSDWAAFVMEHVVLTAEKQPHAKHETPLAPLNELMLVFDEMALALDTPVPPIPDLEN